MLMPSESRHRTRVRLPPSPPEITTCDRKCREFVKIKSRSYCLISSKLRLFCGEQETAVLNAEPYQQWHFAPLFRQKSLKRSGCKSLEHCCLLSTIYKNRSFKDLVYQIDGEKVGFPQPLLRLLICQVLVLICLFAYFADASCRIYYLLF